jgi:hypothetical protein
VWRFFFFSLLVRLDCILYRVLLGVLGHWVVRGYFLLLLLLLLLVTTFAMHSWEMGTGWLYGMVG